MLLYNPLKWHSGVTECDTADPIYVVIMQRALVTYGYVIDHEIFLIVISISHVGCRG